MRFLLACTCLTPLSFALAGTAALAQTVITTRVTTPVATATANAGQPDSLRIASTGAVASTGGVAVTLNSNHNITNEGAIEIRDASNATGLLVSGDRTGNIVSSGRIVIDENFTPADGDKDGDLDGPFAQGTARFGIRIATGSSLTGNLTNSGPITVEGNNSAAISIDGRLVGNLASSGNLAVLGNDSFGVRAGDVTGNVRLTGAIDARGANAVGVALDGAVGGTVSVQGAIVASGYRATTRPADTSKLDADDLLQGGPALRIAGNVAAGVLFDAPPANLDNADTDEDKDGTPDAQEGTATITSFGAAPAVVIGAADRAVTVGALAGQTNGHGLVNRGVVLGDGVYANVAATGLQIGGLGRKASIAGGVTNANRIAATSLNGNATGLRLGDRATAPELRNTGSIFAEGSNAANTRATAVQIDAGASLPTIRNAGVIEAKASAAAGSATAILDAQGSLTLIENTGRIDTSGADPARNVAVDARANTAGLTVRQLTATGSNPPVPRIQGALLFGSGADLLEASAGTVTGNAGFGAGDNRLTLSNAAAMTGSASFGAGADRVSLSGTSSLTGDLDLGGGADQVTISNTAVFRGRVTGAGSAAVTVSGGRFEIAGTGPVALGSLTVAQGGALGVAVDTAAGQSTLVTVAGTASFAQGSSLNLRVTDIGTAEGRFTVLRAGQLTGMPTLAVATSTLPFFYKSALATGTPANELAVEIRRKSATELGLNRSESSAWDAVYRAFLADRDIGNVFLGYTEQAAFQDGLAKLLPDHAGGVFETATQGSRAAARLLSDPRAPFADMGRWGFWLQQTGWGTDKGRGESAAYDIRGWGFSGGAELITGTAGNFGLSLGYMDSDVDHGDNDNEVGVRHYELAGYWRARIGGFNAWARASHGWLNIDSSRFFAGTAGGRNVRRATSAEWDGRLISAAAGAQHEWTFGRMVLRPALSVDWYRLKEDGYAETGGNGLNLAVDKRSSDEFAGTASATLGYQFGSADAGWFRVELEGGRRQILGGSLADTVARFGTAPSFRLAAEDRTDGWLGRLRLLGGGAGLTVSGEASAEEQQGRAAVAVRIGVQMGL